MEDLSSVSGIFNFISRGSNFFFFFWPLRGSCIQIQILRYTCTYKLYIYITYIYYYYTHTFQIYAAAMLWPKPNPIQRKLIFPSVLGQSSTGWLTFYFIQRQALLSPQREALPNQKAVGHGWPLETLIYTELCHCPLSEQEQAKVRVMASGSVESGWSRPVRPTLCLFSLSLGGHEPQVKV